MRAACRLARAVSALLACLGARALANLHGSGGHTGVQLDRLHAVLICMTHWLLAPHMALPL